MRIFRKHGFAWGGNFLIPDGMHFEWVGERRRQDQLPVALLPEHRRQAATEARAAGSRRSAQPVTVATCDGAHDDGASAAVACAA